MMKRRYTLNDNSGDCFDNEWCEKMPADFLEYARDELVEFGWKITREEYAPIGRGKFVRVNGVILAQSRTDAPGTMAAWYRAQQEAK